MSYRCYVDRRFLAEFDEQERAERFVDLVSRYRMGSFEIRDNERPTHWDSHLSDYEPQFEIDCNGVTDWRSAFEPAWGEGE